MGIGGGEEHTLAPSEQPALIERLDQEDRVLCLVPGHDHRHREAHLGEPDAHEGHLGGDDQELCPAAPVHIETISGFAREIPYLKSEFWDSYAGYRASDFAKFVALAQKGDKVATKNTIHKNAAGRRKSRLAKRLNALKKTKV